MTRQFFISQSKAALDLAFQKQRNGQKCLARHQLSGRTDFSHFRVRSADFESAFSVIATAKPTASRRSGLLAFRATYDMSGLDGGIGRSFCGCGRDAAPLLFHHWADGTVQKMRGHIRRTDERAGGRALRGDCLQRCQKPRRRLLLQIQGLLRQNSGRLRACNHGIIESSN